MLVLPLDHIKLTNGKFSLLAVFKVKLNNEISQYCKVEKNGFIWLKDKAVATPPLTHEHFGCYCWNGIITFLPFEKRKEKC